MDWQSCSARYKLALDSRRFDTSPILSIFHSTDRPVRAYKIHSTLNVQHQRTAI
jgi:hypothetical protein